MRNEGEPTSIPVDQQVNATILEPSTSPLKKPARRKSWLLGTGLTDVLLLGGGYWANENPDNAAEFSRSVIGDERTAWLESKVLYLKDQRDQLEYKIFGEDKIPFTQNHEVVTNSQFPEFQSQETLQQSSAGSTRPASDEPFEFVPTEIPKPKPMVLPETTIIQPEAAEGEGVWSVDGLPRTSIDDVLMAKTYIKPDIARPYANVGVLLLDKRRAKLNIMGGKNDPKAQANAGVPEVDIPNLLVAFNGGFQLEHGSWGMYTSGKEYKKLQNGYASIAVLSDGTIKMGTWGEGELTQRTEDMVAVRQNCVLLVQNGEVTPMAKSQGTNNNVWGYVDVNSAEFITWRSAIGLTKEGHIMIASGNSLSAKSLAEGLKAVGADVAMQLDINNPYVQTSLFFQQEGGTLKSSLFMDTMPDKNSRRYLASQNRDFMYITLDETKYKP